MSRIGIADDKIFAAAFLLGKDAFPLAPNQGSTVFSILSLAENDPALRPFILNSLTDIFIDGGDMYAGYDSLIRRLYGITAAGRFELTGELAALDRMRVNCYALATFSNKFNVAATSLGAEATSIPLNNQTSAPEYAGETQVAALKIGDVVYTAAPVSNELGYEIVNASDKQSARNLHSLYQAVVYDRLTPNCE